MVAPRLILVLGDQLSPGLSALRAADRARDVVVMAEVQAEATYVRHHPKKIAFLFAAMRHFAEELRAQGWTVAYTALDDPENSHAIGTELLRRAEAHGAQEVIATQPGEWRLIEALGALPIPVQQLPDDRFLCPGGVFEAWAEGRKELRMEWFYREMRRRTGLLMEGDQPAGGQWNYDKENRKPPPGALLVPGRDDPAPDAVTEEVLTLVEARFADHFGSARPFGFAVTAAGAQAHLNRWLREGLPLFGDYQDAMVAGQPHLYHALIGLYLNAGLLDPLTVCRAAEAEWRVGRAPLNAVEGFIRQIIGWREYIRGIYFLQGPDYAQRNILRHERDLPQLYWGGATQMACLKTVVQEVEEGAYAHHIQRLMVLGNFALLAGVQPAQVQDWFMGAFADAYEWVMSANVIGMSQWADGGIVASKPYVSAGAYIDRMSDYCAGCAYSPKVKTGPKACPFNLLYWHFLDRHRERFEKNPRMGMIYRGWDKRDEDTRRQILGEAADVLARLDAGEGV
ncbi:cryptochrome/photolyase family protein [Pseudoroseicyclus aestuarii]|uniref:Deoxyribodipyrimidine photolyase-related protein n=1 Tax=Pseudoroseicyclus aestuarii TaxID=1795041 RepID=A0A318SPF6_9RHOB|nr:cryptochrome/photolyase family protein [Pseudoroseicyclus aestuarii]PYE83761.1 deoxyribodipyrimidine photolyase-related protein [Pseudoroseicyclus aestuarii]